MGQAGPRSTHACLRILLSGLLLRAAATSLPGLPVVFFSQPITEQAGPRSTQASIRILSTCFAVSGNNIFAGTYGGRVFLSTNNGANWIAANSRLTNTGVNCLAVSGGSIFAGSNKGVISPPITGQVGKRSTPACLRPLGSIVWP